MWYNIAISESTIYSCSGVEGLTRPRGANSNLKIQQIMFRYLGASLEKGYALVDAQFGVCACVRIPIHNLEQTKATHFLIEGGRFALV